MGGSWKRRIRRGGKFRTLLLAASKNLDANAWAAAKAQKRGAGTGVVSLDLMVSKGTDETKGAPGPEEPATVPSVLTLKAALEFEQTRREPQATTQRTHNQ